MQAKFKKWIKPKSKETTQFQTEAGDLRRQKKTKRETVSGLEIATDTEKFATEIFAFATKICRSVANFRLGCGRSVGHISAIDDYLKLKLIKENHIE